MAKHYQGEKLSKGRFILKSLLGEGGMGEVWEAIDVNLNISVAVKFLQTEMANMPTIRKQFMERFLREIQICGQFQHPNIVRVIDAGTNDHGVPFFVMDFVKGRMLSDQIDAACDKVGLPPPGSEDASGAMPMQQLSAPVIDPAHLYPILDQIMNAMSYLHTQGVVHRDLKPQNIMVTAGSDGRPHATLLDFGIAKIADTALEAALQKSRLTMEHQMIGTPDYMPLEQGYGPVPDPATGKAYPVGAYSDVYAIGVIMFEAYTGRLPYGGMSVEERLGVLLNFQMPEADPHDYVSGMNPRLREVIRKAIAKHPKDRYQTVAELLAALHDAEKVDRTRHGITTQWNAALPQATLESALAVQDTVADSSPPPPAVPIAISYSRPAPSIEHGRAEPVPGRQVPIQKPASGNGFLRSVFVTLLFMGVLATVVIVFTRPSATSDVSDRRADTPATSVSISAEPPVPPREPEEPLPPAPLRELEEPQPLHRPPVRSADTAPLHEPPAGPIRRPPEPSKKLHVPPPAR